jgi:polyisoprenyl-teichoic acid--peptidoglycan teichoic acid transferase
MGEQIMKKFLMLGLVVILSLAMISQSSASSLPTNGGLYHLLAVSASALAQIERAEAVADTAAPESAESAVTTEAPVAEAQRGDWWNILLLGGDSRSEKSYERTDSMIILSINMTEGKAKMTSIMRDTWVSFPGMPGHGKINAANVYGGPDLAMETVNQCFGTDIKDYVLINMAGLVDVIDQVGGIDIPITAGERKLINAYAKDYLNNFGDYDGDTSLAKSGDSVHLNGLLAMSYCRNRYIGTDYARTQRQRKVLLAVLDKLKKGGAVQLASVVSSAFEDVKTNLNMMDLLALANFSLKLDMASIEQNRIPAYGTFESGMKDGFWSIRPDFDENMELLQAFIYGAGQ